MEKDTIKVYGANWCGDYFRVKMVLDNYEINYQQVDSDQESGAREIMSQVNDGKIIVSTLVFPDGSILAEPSNQQLKLKLSPDVDSHIYRLFDPSAFRPIF
jgi:glutaredoxin